MLDGLPIHKDPVMGCWRWNGRKDRNGYGLTRTGGKLAYKDVYEFVKGPVGEGLWLDHVCRRRDCVNPAHLEPVTRSENERRKSMRYRKRIRHCPFGHDLYDNGRLTPEGGKICRVCSGV